MLSGLANRRGFQSRLDFEWMKAQQHGNELSLLMIDVDHFKLFNDTYGHPEGDACLTRLGETLAGIAAETMGFAGALWRRGVLPAAAEHRRCPRAARSARWCATRSRGSRCLTPPAAIKPSPSASASLAQDPTSSGPGRSDRGSRRRALCRQTPRPQHRGRARIRASQRWRGSLGELSLTTDPRSQRCHAREFEPCWQRARSLTVPSNIRKQGSGRDDIGCQALQLVRPLQGRRD